MENSSRRLYNETHLKHNHIYPYNITGIDTSSAVSMLLDVDFDDCNFCNKPLRVHYIKLHSPKDYPQMMQKTIPIPASKYVVVVVKPSVIIASDNIRRLSVEKRQCYFENERELSFFRQYTQANCYLECRTNFTIRRCACVNFNMPRNSSTPVCGLNRLKCSILSAYLEIDNEDCNCLPTCASVDYDTKVLQFDDENKDNES